jgi:hypothetical protein
VTFYAFRKKSPDPFFSKEGHAVGRRAKQRVARRDAERVMEAVHMADDAVRAVFLGRVLLAQQRLPQVVLRQPSPAPTAIGGSRRTRCTRL